MTLPLALTTTQRIATIWPFGRAILDTTLDQFYMGDGATLGGIPVQTAASNITSLGSLLRSQGWSIIGMLPINLSAGSVGVPTSVFGTSARDGYTTRISEYPSVSVPAIKLLYGNWWGQATANYYWATTSEMVITASVNTRGGNQTGVYPVMFNGQRIGSIFPGQILASDPIYFRTTANTQYDIYNYIGVTSSAANVVGGYQVGGTSSIFNTQPNDTAGTNAGDCTMACTATTTGNPIVGYTPIAIMGLTANKPIKTIAVLGDSIFDGTGDGGGINQHISGYGCRIALGGIALTNVNIQYPSIGPAAYPFVQNARGGATMANLLTVGNNNGIFQATSLATTVICDLGVNDLSAGASLATMKANVLTLAGIISSQNQKLIMCTITPRTTSTDGWTTTVNQTQLGFESTRQGYNSWLIDPSANGFVQQAATATGQSASMFAASSAPSAVEVNSSGVQTFNGGYWRPPTHSVAYTGSVTTGNTSANTFTDSNFSTASQTYRGYGLIWTSGANANSVNCMYNTNKFSSGVNMETVTSLTTTAGDAYEFILDLPTIDGTHPTSYSHMAISAAFNTNLIV